MTRERDLEAEQQPNQLIKELAKALSKQEWRQVLRITACDPSSAFETLLAEFYEQFPEEKPASGPRAGHE